MSKFKGLFSNNGLLSKLLILIGFSWLFAVLAMFVWNVITQGNTTDVGSLKLLQFLLSIGMFVLPSLVVAYLCSGNVKQFLHLDKSNIWTDIALLILFMIVMIPFVNLLGDLNQKLVLPKIFAGLENMMRASEDRAVETTAKLLNVHTIQALFLNVFLIALIPALGEELFFRAALQGVFQEKINMKAAIWVVAVIFSFIHFQFYGFLPRMLMGAFFGYLLFWSENLWLPIIAHFTNNAFAVVFYYLKNNGCKLPDVDKIGTGNTLWLGCISGVLVILGVAFFMQRFRRSNTKIVEL